ALRRGGTAAEGREALPGARRQRAGGPGLAPRPLRRGRGPVAGAAALRAGAFQPRHVRPVPRRPPRRPRPPPRRPETAAGDERLASLRPALPRPGGRPQLRRWSNIRALSRTV